MSSKFPEESKITEYLPANYSDILSYEVETEECINPDDVQVLFWTKLPKWVEILFKIRSTLVKLVGLKGDGGKDLKALEECIRNGGSYQMMSVVSKSKNETILRLDDTHLTAHISIYVEKAENGKQKVSAITLVHFHKLLGRIYFYGIAPFHYFVVKGMLKRSVKATIKNK